MTTQIVTVNVSQTIAPAPSQLQRTGCFVSQGGSNKAIGSVTLITQLADLTAIINPAVTISTIVWATNVVTVTTATAHGIPTGTTVQGVIAGCSPTGYNGTFAFTATGTTTFTYPLTTNPGVIVTKGTAQLYSALELTAMGTTFFAQGATNPVYVLELGVGTDAAGVTALTAYLADPTVQMYGYLLPASWADETTAVTMVGNNGSTTGLVYFWITASLSNYTSWVDEKAAVVMVQDASAPITECSIAAMFWNALAYNPSNTNKVAPMAFKYLVGVTPFTGSRTVQQQLKSANVNYVGTGAEGGISNALVLWGVTNDGRDYTYWYSVDWIQININLSLSNAIINGSNNPINPLYYNQAGINTLQKVAQGTVNSGIAFGLVLAPATVQAVSFADYVASNPSDYSIGKYAGLSLTYTPARGFIEIIFNVNVTDFVLA